MITWINAPKAKCAIFYVPQNYPPVVEKQYRLKKLYVMVHLLP